MTDTADTRAATVPAARVDAGDTRVGRDAGPDAAGARLERLRGPVPPLTFTARTIAALTTNPGCERRAVLDAAGVDKRRVAVQAGFPAPTGQSRFAITRGTAFEAQVKANGAAELIRLLRDKLGLALDEVAYADADTDPGDDETPAPATGHTAERYARTRALLARAAGNEAGTLFDHPMLRLTVGGRDAYLEPDLVAFQVAGRFHVIEIKSFAIVDGQADGGKVAAAATQAAVYVLALRDLLAELGHAPDRVADTIVLVCPENFSNRPTAVLVDVRRQVAVLRRQLSRLDTVDRLVAALPEGLSLDLAVDDDGTAQRPAAEMAGALREIPSRYAPDCLDSCDLAYFCRGEARGSTAALGRTVRDDLGGVDGVSTALEIAEGTRAPAEGQSEAAELLRTAARLRREVLAASR